MEVIYMRDEIEPLSDGMIRVEPIIHKYEMPLNIQNELRKIEYHFGYGGFSECVFNRTYARIKSDGTKENFYDVIIRVVNGCISIQKNWRIKNGLEWNENYWNEMAYNMGETFLKMRALPSGRGLWACGTEFGYSKGSSAFNNCGFCSVSEGLAKSATWTMNALMSGCGVGFDTLHKIENGIDEFENVIIPGCELCSYSKPEKLDCCNCKKIVYTIHDSREGWVKSLNLLLKSYMGQLQEGKGTVVHFDYSELRPRGEPIKGFGGHASGFFALLELHQRIRSFFECFVESRNPEMKVEASIKMIRRLKDLLPESSEWMIKSLENAIVSIPTIDQNLRNYSPTRLICDIFNSIGCCVVAGNVRRSSEICLGSPGDEDFLNLKNYSIYPERVLIGWMSNNTVALRNSADFIHIPSIVERIKDNGEPGLLNMINVRQSGRVGAKHPIGREAEPDMAIGINPCLTSDTMIFTSEGIRPISELIGKKFTTSEGYDSTDNGFWSSGIKDVYKIVMHNGVTIKATKNHKFLTFDGIEFRWTEVRDFEIGDQLCLYHGENVEFIRSLFEESSTDDRVLTDNPRELQMILSFLGIKSKVIENGLIVGRENISKIINGEIEKYCTVESVSFYGTEEVYDCSIPGKNSFPANGLISHNCGEIPLESYEYCNLAEVFPNRCENYEQFRNAAIIATIYTSTISLLPSDSVDTNRVVAKNRRIGVSISGISNFYKKGYCKMIDDFKKIYRVIRETNMEIARDVGVRSAIRVTTVKPSGTLSNVVGESNGIHFNTYEYCIRRMRIDNNSDLIPVLTKAGYPIKPEIKSPDTTCVVEFPLHQGEGRTSDMVSMWEQAALQQAVQRHYSDNSVSCTIYFNPATESADLEHCISMLVPSIKSVSVLPHTPEGKYEQMPYEKITKVKYEKLSRMISKIDWTKTKEDSEAIKGCDGDSCQIVRKF